MSGFDYFALLFRQTTVLSPRLSAALETLQRDSGLHQLQRNATQIVLAAEATPTVRLGEAGIVIGYLFDWRSFARVLSLPSVEAPAEQFVRSYWGGYVALRSRHGTPEILRDPSGTVPCYTATIDDVQVVTSRPKLLFDLGLLEPDLDWAVVAQALVFADIKPARTALRGLTEILPGVVGRFYPTGLQTDCAWSPWQHIAYRAPADFDAATEAVRNTVTRGLMAWGACFERPMLEVSGGLDSSIVAAVIVQGGGSKAFTYAAIDGDPDETPFAKAVADHLGLELAVLSPDIDLFDITQSSAAGLPRPYARCFTQGFDQGAAAHAQSKSIDVFFSGGGGDNVFCYLQSLAPAIDRIRAEGFARGAFATITDVAALGGANVWEIAFRTVRRLLRSGKSPWFVDRRLLSSAAVEKLPFPQDHPWTDVPKDAPMGKILHIRSLIMIQNHLEGLRRTAIAPVISPLLAQPVMETCLAIPSWLWCAGGNNRAVARAAFAGSLPESVVARRTKGAFDNLAARLLEANRPVVRELLLEGVLAAQGMLDTIAIEAGLAGCDPFITVRLWQLVDAEVWARNWLGNARRAE